MGEHSIFLWGGFLLVVAVLLAFDLGILHKKNKEIGFRDASRMVGFYVFLAACFGTGIYYFIGADKGTEFFTGYLIELTLSVDNVFVFALVFAHFAVPKQYQYRVLFWGVLGAIIMRFIFIMLGTSLIKEFAWVLYLFGAFLVFTGLKMLKASSAEPDIENNIVVKFARKNFRITKDYAGDRFFTKENGVRYATPLFVVLLVVEFTDVVFAVDSIPAIFAVTIDPFIVFTSNIFAILGLRSMYFVLANVIQRFKYLKYGLSVLLVFIGCKMIMNHYLAPQKLITTAESLIITAVIITFSIVFSLYKTRGVAYDQPFTGWVPGSPSEEKKDKNEQE